MKKAGGQLTARWLLLDGIWIVNVVPLPGLDFTAMLPPCPETICLQIDNPRPVPGTLPSEALTR